MKSEEIINRLRQFFLERGHGLNIEAAFLYGSWVAGHPHEESDVDIAVLFHTYLDEDQVFDRITTISIELTRLLEKEVNVIAIDPDMPRPMLYYNVIVKGTPVYIRDFSRYVDLRMSALFWAEDFNIFGRKWQAEVVRKRLEAMSNA